MNRRQFLKWSGSMAVGASLSSIAGAASSLQSREGGGNAAAASVGAGRSQEAQAVDAPDGGRPAPLSIFLAGDVMTGRGIDQVLPHSVDPQLFEPYVKDARRYVELAERENGPIPEEVPYDFVWGDALEELARVDPHARIVNLETAVTDEGEPWPGKGIHYRMHPGNVELLAAAGLDVTVLGNNHVLDWGYEGLEDTLASLQSAGLRTPGAGADAASARAPAALATSAGRILVFSFGTPSAGVPASWAAQQDRPGVNFLPDSSARRAEEVAELVRSARGDDERVVLSIHWGPNWGYDVPAEQREFAHALIDAGAADIVHGHSSHHPKGIEVYRGRPILYGAGDLLNDYEGIGGHEEFRPELTLMYFPTFEPDGTLRSLEMTPMRIRRFRLEHASTEQARWLADRLDRESRSFGAGVELTEDDRLALRWG